MTAISMLVIRLAVLLSLLSLAFFVVSVWLGFFVVPLLVVAVLCILWYARFSVSVLSTWLIVLVVFCWL